MKNQIEELEERLEMGAWIGGDGGEGGNGTKGNGGDGGAGGDGGITVKTDTSKPKQ